MFRKLSLEQQALQQKGEDKGGSITGQFSKIGQNRGKLGKTEREQLFISLLSSFPASTSTDN